ncbi:iron-containing alcohol dehydrogenase [candidate division WOR-3 bacterium]|nr:iron-containing alcohol dehydrogenase [candidate division WOR-3 bacterium]MCK4528482.1 iron-containing alcohol dehydrogenase [candidate division WOR-3 bacterium]
MALISRIVDIPLFLYIESGCVDRLGEILSRNNLSFESVLLLSGPTTFQVLGEKVAETIRKTGSKVSTLTISDSTIDTAEKVTEKIKNSQYSVVFGVGGGKVIDIGKYAAANEGINFISVPTTVANDGISSPVSVITYNREKRSIMTKMPIGVIADIEVIKNAPIRTIRAGIGDLLSNISAVKDWELASQVKGDSFDEFSTLLSSRAAESVLNSDLDDILTEKFLNMLVGSLILSGISMGIAGSSKPCSGAEHKFSHALDAVAENPALHGEQAGLGLIITSFLRGDDWKRFISIFKRWGIPTTARELNISREDIIRALLYAPTTRPERYTILEHISIDEEKAMNAAKKTGVIE